MKLKIGAEQKSATQAIQVTSKTLFKIDEFLAPRLAGRRSGAQPAKIAPQGRFLKFKVLQLKL